MKRSWTSRLSFGMGLFGGTKRSQRGCPAVRSRRLAVEQLEARVVMAGANVFGVNMFGPGPVVADGRSVDVITGRAWGFAQLGATANPMLTVATDLGTIRTPDADPTLSGHQVAAPQGQDFRFSVEIERPRTAGTPAVTVTEASAPPTRAPFGGTVTDPAFLSYTLSPTAATTTTVTSSSPTSTYGSDLIFTAAVHDGSSPVTAGTVTFVTPAGSFTAALDASGNARLNVETLLVGTHTITATYGGASGFATSTGSVLQTVNPAVLTVTAANATRTYGAANPAISPNYTGFVLGQDASSLSGTLSTAATAASPPGVYTMSGLSSPNYQINYVGTLTVTKAPLTVIANNVSRFFGQPNPPLSVRYIGFVLDQNASVLGGTLQVSTPATPTSPPGVYPITASGLTSDNYAITYSPGTLEVLPAPSSNPGWSNVRDQLDGLARRVAALDRLLPSISPLMNWFTLTNFAMGDPDPIRRAMGVAIFMGGFSLVTEVYIQQGRFGAYTAQARGFIEDARAIARAAVRLGFGDVIRQL